MTTSRLIAALRALVAELLPAAISYHAPVRYRVVLMSVDRVVLQAVRKGAGYPDIGPIDQRPGAAGAWAELTLGTEVLVQFIEGDPTQPVITHFASKSAAAWLPVRTTLDATSEVRLGEHATQTVVGPDADSPAPVARAAEVQSALDDLAAGLNAVLVLVATATPALVGTPVLKVALAPPYLPVSGLDAGATDHLRAS